MRHLAFCLLSLSTMPLAMAADASVQGVWRGTLGNIEKTACFNLPSKFDNRGNYY